MAKIEYKVCDRCGQKMEYIGWTARIQNVFKRGKRILITEYYNGNPDGYSYSERYYELCADCTNELKDFLINKKGD